MYIFQFLTTQEPSSQIRLQLLILSKPLGPNALFPRRKDTIRIHSILDCLDKPPVRIIVEIIQRGHAIHSINMTAILAIPPLLARFKQPVENTLHSAPILCIRLVKRKHVYKNNMALMHEEVAKEVEVVALADFLGRFDPGEDFGAAGRDNGGVVVVGADAGCFLSGRVFGDAIFDHGQGPEGGDADEESAVCFGDGCWV